jgi:hypothetical protein
MNRRLRSDNTSGYKGVFRLSSTGKWQARITVDKRRVHLGTFDDPETAYSAYKKAARKYHGEFACLR